jgi:ribosome modulation factor
MKSKLLLLSMATLAVSACSTATMTKDECRTVDWRTVGYEDGVAGRSGEQIGAHRRACAEHGVTPDLAAYRAGRAEGLREFCQPHNGYRAGVTGVAYQDVCPEDLAAAFLVQYEAGRELYVHEQRVRDADAQLSAKRYEVTRLEDAVARSGFRVISETSTTEQRAQAVLDAKQYAERIGRLKSEIAQLEKDRARYAQELETYRATVASTN